MLAIINYEYVRDFVSGRLEYKWLFSRTAEGGLSLRYITLFLIIGMGAGFLVSKLLKELKKAPQKAAAIANGEKERLFKFAVVGGSGLLLKLILMGLGVELLGISQYIVIFPAALIVNASNFTLNTLWTFKGFNPGIKGYFKYLGLNAISFIGYMGVYYTFLATGQHYLMAGFYGVCTIGLINFALSRLKIWKLS